MKPININNAEHYIWGEVCDGWHLLKREGVSIIQERVPPGRTEAKHFHHRSRQLLRFAPCPVLQVVEQQCAL